MRHDFLLRLRRSDPQQERWRERRLSRRRHIFPHPPA
jgi:hypothetical protein